MSTNDKDSLDVDLNVSLSDLIDRQMLAELCETFFPLVGVSLRVFDGQHRQLAAAASKDAHLLCQQVQSVESGRKACTDFKQKVRAFVPTAQRNLQRLRCFCGLYYSVAPIVFQGRVLGKLLLGPHFVSNTDLNRETLAAKAPDLPAEKFEAMFESSREHAQVNLEQIAQAMISSIDLILFSAQKAHATTQTHLASLKESHKELSAKNRELKEKNERLGELEKLKSSFLATVSHELRTPLTSIIGYSDALYDGIVGSLGEEQREFIATIRTKGEQLLGLITSILDFSRIDAGRIDLALTTVPIKAVVESALEKCRSGAERRGVHLTYDPLEPLPEMAVDPDKMVTAIGHLIDNAVKFSSPGSLVRVEVKISQVQECLSGEEEFGFVLLSTPQSLEINVVDHGMGIRHSDQHRVFDPFAQCDGSSTREHGGAGLGLAIVKSYVEAHGGRVLVESSPGEGSCFSIRLPLTEPTPQE
jgi:signal transduction histidine kinase